MRLEEHLKKTSIYTEEQVANYCEIVQRAQSLYDSNPPSPSVSYATPRSVTEILAEWCLPWPIIETAVWGVALYDQKEVSIASELGKTRARLAYQLAKLNSLITEHRRQNLQYIQLDKILLGSYWPDSGKLILRRALIQPYLSHRLMVR
jgi:hypothetical protein